MKFALRSLGFRWIFAVRRARRRAAHDARSPSAMHKLTAEVAISPDQRSLGLMNRFSLKPDHGMLFVFERTEPLSFWMKNTFIPLSIAFIARRRPHRQHRGHEAADRGHALVARAPRCTRSR